MSLTLPWLDPASLDFPDPAGALASPNGLLALGGDLSPLRLLAAYQRGIFPWYDSGQPILWWSPDPRMVLFPAEVHVSHSLKKVHRRAAFSVTSDLAFRNVIAACAATRINTTGTWLSDEMQAAYLHLHRLGHAHSIEVWHQEELVGGLYGIALEGVFFGESMFSLISNASKIAMVWLAKFLEEADYRVIDCQVPSQHLASMGARQISRSEFMQYLPGTTTISTPAPWPLQYAHPGR